MANSDGREAFSKRLRQALQQGGVALHSPTRLAEAFNDRYQGKPITQQTVRKWLNGISIPRHDKILVLAEWLGMPADMLEYGKGGGAAGPAMQQASPAYRSILSDEELLKRYRKLNQNQQRAVAEIISGLAGKDRRR